MSDKAQQRYNNRLRASIILMIEEANASVLPERRVSIGSAMAVASRSLDATKNSRSGDKARTFAALRAVSQFVSLATKNRESSAALAHSDLLPIGHPASTARHAMTAGALLHARAQWIAADPYIDSSVRSLVATAYSQPRNTIERSHAFARIAAVDFGLVPQSIVIDAQTAITAAFGFGTGGNSSAARRARAMLQRRDRKGRFADMGGMFRFKVKLRSGKIVPVSGRVVGAYDGDAEYMKSFSDGIQIELPRSLDGKGTGGIYILPSSKGESAPAIISEEYLKDLPGVEIPESLPDGPDVVSESDPLFKVLGVPSGWSFNSANTYKDSQTPSFQVFSTPDGYFAKVPKGVSAYAPESKDKWTLHRANLEDNSIGDEVARGSSWADLVVAAAADQDEYEKVLLAQDEGTSRSSLPSLPVGWTVSEEQPPVYNETGQLERAVYSSPSGEHQIWQEKAFGNPSKIKGADYDYTAVRKMGGRNVKGVYIEDREIIGKDLATLQDAIDIVKRDGPQNEEAKKRASGELPPRPAGTGKEWAKHEGAWIEREIGASYDFSDDQLTKFAEKAFNLAYPQQPKSDFVNQKKGWYKNSSGKWKEWDEGPGQTFSQYMAERRSEIKSYFKRLLKMRNAQDAGAFDPAKDGPTDDSTNFYKKVSAGVESQRTEPLYVEGAEPAAVPEAPAAELPASVDLNPDASDSLTSQIKSAIGNKQSVRFKYSGTDREITPTKVWTNPKNGNVNVTADDGKNYTVGKIEAPTPVAVPEQEEEVSVPEVPGEGETRANVVNLTDVPKTELRSSIDKAIAEEKPVVFMYNDKLREVTPVRIWDNPKNGKVNLTAVDSEGTEKNYTLDKFAEPVDSKIVQTELDDIINMPQEELDDFVDAVWPVPAPDLARVIEPPVRGLQSIDTKGSTAVEELAYDNILKKLYVQFKSKDGKFGGIYEYIGVGQDFADRIAQTDSIGKLIPELKKDYKAVKINQFPIETPGAFTGFKKEAPSKALTDFQMDGIKNYDLQELVEEFEALKTKDGLLKYQEKILDLLDKREEEMRAANLDLTVERYTDRVYGVLTKLSERVEESDLRFLDDAPKVNASEFDEELFDSIFETPDGAYKPNIYETYEPTGRTVQDSADYTDDPNLLSTKFDMGQLVRALAEAVLPSDNNPATGKGNLPFESGDEPVAAEAIIEAIDAAGLNGDVILAGIYDRALDPDREETNVARLIDAQDSIPTKQTSTFDDRREAIDKAVDLNAQLGTPQRAARAVSEMANFQEKNPKITQLADDLKEMQDSGAAFDEIAFSDALDKYLPLSTSADPQDREAFSALWGMFMSLDGGSSTEEEFVTPGSFRNLVVQGISRQTQADEATAMDAYDELINNYGGVPEFVAGKQAIADGKASLDDESTAGAFFRLVKAAARPNSTTLWRSIGVRQDDPLKDQYTTPGSTFSIDPRSFTAEPLQMSNGGITPSYAVTDPDVDRVVFKIDAFDGSSISAEGISWFPEELEHFAYGTYEVRDVKRTKSMIPGRQDDYVVTIEQVEAPDLSVIDPWNGQKRPGMWWNDMPKSGLFDKLTDYGDISEWNRISGQTGSNAGGFYQDAQGNGYYAKVARSQSHADNEMLASAFYKEFGIKASEVGYGMRNGDLQVITPLIPGASSDIDDNIRDGDEKVINQLRDAFAVDAWLANYDVLGAVNDNVVTDRNGDAVRLDPGGALMWRARGGPKEWWGDSVDEIDTMRDPDWNETAAAVFSGMTDEEVKNSARFVAAITPSRIDEIVDSVITDPDDAEMLKERLKRRREDLLNRLGIDIPEIEDVLDEPVSLKNAMGYAAKDLAENDVSIGDSFTIERVFTDEDTPKGKVSVQGYFPGHESQRKEWNENTVIDVVRGGTIPPKGDKPALHRPKAPYEPSPPAFTGSISSDLADATTWSQVQDVLNGKDLIFFDYETTGFPDKETGEVNTNKPVQLGAVRVRNGEVVDRFNVFMNPGENLGTWSRNNLKDSDGNPLTDEWLGSQVSLEDAHKDFVTWLGDSAILGGHNVPFDRGVLEKALAGANIDYTPGGYVDTLRLARDLVAKKTKKNPEGTASHKLGDLTEYYGIPLEGWHTADADAEAASALLGALVTDAAGRPDADVSALNLNEQNTKYQEALSQFQALKDEYADSLAQYETDKAIAAAWDCNGGGGGMTSAGEESSNCNVPSLDDLIKNATPQPQDFIDPDGVDSGSVSSPVSYVDNGDEVPESDGIDTRPATETAGTTGTNWPPVDDPDDAFTPTAQQQAVFEAVFADNNVVIRAAAGAGKTSTLVTLAKRIGKYFPNKKIVYIAFNTSVANEGRKKMPGNVEVRTADSIAHGYVKDNMPELFKKFKSTTSLYSPNEIAEWLSVPAIQYTADDGTRKTMEPRGVVRILRGALYNFSISDDETLMTKHFDVPTEDVTPALLYAAERWWKDILDPNGQMPFGFGQMKKIWSLSNPDFSSTSSGLKNAVDFVFLDEAQDTNDVLGSVVRDQPDTVKKVIVGDENQAIYSFMGATNWLDKADTDVDLPLTQSWRFNQVIANVANKFLVFKEQYLDQPMKFVVEGGGPGGEVVPRRSMENADIVLVRSNAGAFDEVLTELDRGKTVGVTASFRNDMVDFASAVEWLQADPATRGKRPAKMPEELREFKSWKEVLNEAEKEDSDLSRKNNILVGMVEEEGVAGLNSIISQLKTVKGAGDTKDVKTGVDRAELPDTYEDGDSGSLVGDLKFEVDGNDVVLRGNTYGVKEEIKKIGKSVVAYNPDRKVWVVAGKTDEEKRKNLTKIQDQIAGPDTGGKSDAVDVIISTVHQAKGLEYPNVRIGGDFRGPRQDKQGNWTYPSIEEINIAYVAVTRPESQIDMGSLDWINDYVSDARVDEAMEKLSIAGKKPAPALDITDEPASPAPTVLPEIVDEVADTPESVLEGPFGDLLIPEPSARDKARAERDKERAERNAERANEDANDPDNWEQVPVGFPPTSYEWRYIGPRREGTGPVFPPQSVIDKKRRDMFGPENYFPAKPASPPDGPDQPPAPSPTDEGAVGRDKDADLDLAFESVLDWVDQITDPDAEGDMKMKPSAKMKAREIADEISSIRSQLASGEITKDQALAQLNTLLDSLPDFDGATNDQINLWTLVQEIQEVRNILDGTYYQRPTGKGLPPIDAVDSKGRPVGYSRDGIFLTPGKRVRDKWGYAGTVEAYNEGDWINVYVRYDIDPRDPEKVKKGNWGPGVARVSKNPTTLTVLDPNDDTPWIDNGKIPENKKPKRLDEQVAALKTGQSGKGEKGGGLPKVKAPEGANEAPEVAENISEYAGIKPVENPGDFLSKIEKKYKKPKGIGMVDIDEDDDAMQFANYGQGGANDVNRALAQDSPLSGDDKEAVERIDRFLEKAPLLDDILVYRGVASDTGADAFRTMQPGDVFVSPTYASTSILEEVAVRFAAKDGLVLEIVVPKDKKIKGIFMDPFYGVEYAGDSYDEEFLSDAEAELVLPRNMKYSVISNDGNRVKLVALGREETAPEATSEAPEVAEESSSTSSSSTYLNNVPGPSERPINSRVEDMEVLDPNDVATGTWVLYTTKQSAEDMITNGVGTPVVGDLNRGVRKGLPEGSLFVGMHDWPMMQYISSQWDADYPGEERVAVTVRIPDDLKMISIPNAPTYTDLINSGVPSDIANRQDEYIALAKAENLTYPEYVAAARMAYDAGYEAVVFDYEGMLILPSAQDRDDARKAILLEEGTKEVPNIVESPSPAQAPVSEWNRTLEPEDLAATEQKFKKDYEDNGVKPKYVGYDDPVRYYQSNGYRAMNAILRGDVSWLDTEGDGYEDPTDNVEEAGDMILELDAVMRSMPATSEDLVSYRGISSKNQEMMDLISSLEVGGVFEDPGFVSTTLDRDRAEFFAEFDGQLVEILTPAGAVGVMTNAYLQDDNAWYQEREWILDRGTSFQVVSKKDGVITVVATKQTDDGDKPSLSDIKKNLRNIEEQENLVKWRGATTSTVKSPITGESVTVVRGLSGDDVWSLRNDELTPPASMLPVFIPMYPEGDKEHEGDGWYFARSGKRYWGQFGAAGALLVRKGTNGKNEYLLGKRAAWMSSGGGKWAYPGGAHSNAENAFFTLRTVTSEVKEELGIDLDDYQFSGLDEFDSQVEPDWKYTTLFIPEPPSGFPEPKISDIETELTGWFTADDIKQMDATGSLHESMSAVLDELLAKGEETVFSTEQVHLDPDSDTPKAFVARYGMSSGEIQRMAEDLSRHFGDMRARLATKLETQNSIEDTLKSIPDAKKDSLSALRITFEGLLKEIWSGPKLTSSERDEKFYGILLNALDGDLDEDDDARDEVTLGSTVVDGVRIEPTGAPVREIENPLPLSESGIAGVASLGSAVALVRSGAENIDRPPGGLAAVAAAVDGVDIEDLQVRVFPVVTPDGENRIRLKFKLTAWSGTMLAQKIEKSIDGAGQKLGWTKTDAGRVQLQASTLDSATGKLILSNDKVNPGYGAYQGASANDVFPWEDDGVSYLIDPDDSETPDSSPRIEFIRSTADPRRLHVPTGQYIGAPAAFHNLVTIDLPYDATESDIADALRLAGVRDVRSADRTDANTLIENKLISQFSGDTNPAYNIMKPSLRADTLEGIENKWGAKADDVDIVSSPSGRIEYLLPESVAEKLVKTTGVTYMLHTIHNGLRDELYAEQQRRHDEGRNNNIPYEETMMTLAQKSEVAAKFIARLLAKGSLQSTVTRSTEGIPVRGWSTLEDIATGGADYVFLSPRDIKGAISLANDGLNPTDIEFIWESKPLFRNMSTYANAYDAYGERSDGTKIQEVRSGYSEFIVKNEVSFDTLDTLSVAAGVKGPLIEELNQMGITEIGGKPLDEVIEIVGERSKSRVAEEKGMSAEEVAKVAQTLSDAGIEGIDYDVYTSSLVAAFPKKFPDGFIPAPAGSKVIMAPDTYLTVGGAYKDAVGLTVLEPNGQIYVYHKNGEDSTKPELVWQAGQGGAEKLADHLAESAKSGNLVKKYLPKPGEFGSMQTSTGITEHSAKIVYVVGLKDASADVQVGAYPNVPGGHTGADQPVVSATVEPPSLETIMAAYRTWIGSGDPASSVLSILSAYLNVRIPLQLRAILVDIIKAIDTGDMGWENRNPEVTEKMTELSVRNSSQAGVRAMTADGEEIAVLPMSSFEELIETRSYVNDYVLLEVMSGKGKGSTRRVAHIQTIDQGDHTGNIALYVPTEENALILPLDKNKNVVFGPGNRFGTFTSRGIKYRIKPIPAVKNQTKPAQSSEPTDGR